MTDFNTGSPQLWQWQRCTYRPEPGEPPAQDCWSIFTTAEAMRAHVEQFHPSRLHCPQGTPLVMLGFTRQELDEMERLAWPSTVETWIHERVTAALATALDQGEAQTRQLLGYQTSDGCLYQPEDITLVHDPGQGETQGDEP